MIQLYANIAADVELSAQIDEGVKTEGKIIDDQVSIKAQPAEGAGLTAKLLPAVLLVACLTPVISLDAQMLPPEWTDGTPANLITADGYFIETADGYLLCVQEEQQ